MAGGHELDRRLVVEPVDRVHGLVAGKAEHVLHALAHELAGEGLATGHLFGCHRSTSSAPGRPGRLPKMYTVSKIERSRADCGQGAGRGGGRGRSRSRRRPITRFEMRQPSGVRTATSS